MMQVKEPYSEKPFFLRQEGSVYDYIWMIYSIFYRKLAM